MSEAVTTTLRQDRAERRRATYQDVLDAPPSGRPGCRRRADPPAAGRNPAAHPHVRPGGDAALAATHRARTPPGRHLRVLRRPAHQSGRQDGQLIKATHPRSTPPGPATPSRETSTPARRSGRSAAPSRILAVRRERKTELPGALADQDGGPVPAAGEPSPAGAPRHQHQSRAVPPAASARAKVDSTARASSPAGVTLCMTTCSAAGSAGRMTMRQPQSGPGGAA